MSEDGDFTLAHTLLAGRTDEMGETTFLKGEDETNARRALSRVLLSGAPLHPTLAAMLAALFEPDPDSRPFGRLIMLKIGDGPDWISDYCDTLAAAERTLTFKLRSNVRRTPPLRDEIVWSWIQCRVDEGVRVKLAQSRAMEKFGLKQETIRQIWLKWCREKSRRPALMAALGKV
jgi:hypothetical protein